MQFYYRLEGKKIVACTLEEANTAFGDTLNRVAIDRIGKVKISTVFLVINCNHNFDDPVPLVFETMVFGGKYDQYCERYSTWQDAEEGHSRVKAMVLHEYKRNRLWTRIANKLSLWTRK